MATGRNIDYGTQGDDFLCNIRKKCSPDFDANWRVPVWEDDREVPQWVRDVAHMCWKYDPQERIDQFGAGCYPMDGLVRLLCDKNEAEARKAMLLQCAFGPCETEHPFLEK